MSDIKEFNLIDVRNNSTIVNDLNNVYKLWGYEEVSPSFINNLDTIKGSEVINEDELIGIVSNNSLCLRPEMTTSIVKLTSTRLLNKKRPIRLYNSGIVFNKKQSYKNTYKFQENLQSGIELISYDTKFPEIEVINILFDAIDNINLIENSNLTLLVSTTKIMDLILFNYKNNNYEEIKKCMVNLDQESLNRLNIDKNDQTILKELIFTRGEPEIILKKLKNIYGYNDVIKELENFFNTLSKIAKRYNIKIQLDPTYQPHLNLYAGIVFQLICENSFVKTIIAKGGRYDELVRYFNPNEKIINGIGFTISIDNLRELIIDDSQSKKKVLLLFKDSCLLDKGINEQKALQKKGITTILHLNPCNENSKANILMKEHNCTEIQWIK
ncbi:possible Histidyl-tRNA synthetase [Prochlorococcus marinus str. MIT 9515]|uniref:Possible Histidyl-tRNA synthetase n=1 Tax=Prochlorococcus marinus (strain MIT 9515) TaxID=167542 RepID=A2BWM8_PROM5|nr:ATP phosphoribosyltransferase regulatory subunit [Prochlorococcus marinus]ABM72189.1 possible Histidyl-tRNA synthetase [Prochlorococcus marinus str. MIT 9515]